MGKFHSRNELAIFGGYEIKEQLKEWGCHWSCCDQCWYAPNIEVAEMANQKIEELTLDTQMYGRANWTRQMDGFDENFIKELESTATFKNQEPATVAGVAYTPTREDAVKIAGLENTRRYWRDASADLASEFLASGRDIMFQFDNLIDAGWKSRQITLIADIVTWVREHPPIPAIDEDVPAPHLPAPKAEDTLPDWKKDGTISVLCHNGTPTAFKIQFPYSERAVSSVKEFPGRKWHADKKYWSIPIDSRLQSGLKNERDVFDVFTGFSRSPKADDLYKNQASAWRQRLS